MGSMVNAYYAYDVKTYIFPYFRDNPTSALKSTPKELDSLNRFVRQEDDASANAIMSTNPNTIRVVAIG